VERDYIMNPEQAKDYGMIDEIILSISKADFEARFLGRKAASE